ncbi:DUF3027 domain-containing protein [Ruania halotolerans]|uniref:DUF3027 domain-containing protein n=1 Tax=Ruania halotolerans TaxID=2897773 RepID=UPI001E52A55F|nr:DUF3027 domain-containing protein [Ruania halotolerans]UFU07270.1 DUF3027 domain-containing protein [Ruania halotolerans]
MTTPTFTPGTDSPGTGRRPAKDAVLEGAVELARTALAENTGAVGAHLGFEIESERLGIHWFEATMPGYRGWRWYVTVARAPRSRTPTICESGLLPGEGSLLAPAWLPWSERLAPGDLNPTDRLPHVSDDPRLEQGYVATGDPEQDRVAIIELGLGRDRVMNAKAIDAAATRWYSGSRGPESAGARAADQPCAACGFVIPLGGSLGQLFGVCANEWSPDDGKVVSLDHGCGAHSETDVPPQGHEWTQSELVVDEQGVDVLTVDADTKNPADPAAD